MPLHPERRAIMFPKLLLLLVGTSTAVAVWPARPAPVPQPTIAVQQPVIARKAGPSAPAGFPATFNVSFLASPGGTINTVLVYTGTSAQPGQFGEMFWLGGLEPFSTPAGNGFLRAELRYSLDGSNTWTLKITNDPPAITTTKQAGGFPVFRDFKSTSPIVVTYSNISVS